MLFRKLSGFVALLVLVTACGELPTEPEALDSGLLSATADRTVKMVPYKAKQTAAQADASGVVCPEGEQAAKGLIEGNGTHLGHFTGVTISCGAPTSPTTLQFSRVDVVLVAANGDELWTSMDPANPAIATITSFEPPIPFIIKGAGIVTGGTGRFAGASGYMNTVTTGAFFDPNPNVTTVDGMLSSPGSIKWSTP